MQPITNQILQVFEKYRMPPLAIDQYEQTGKAILTNKMDNYINQNKSIQFAMLGLPFKSTNDRDKVLGQLPDLGEELTVKNFETFDSEIKKIYSPGIGITVASDGYMFNDLLGVTNATVDNYKRITESFKSTNTLNILDLSDFYKSGSLESKREMVMREFSMDWVLLEQQILLNPDTNMLYKGMIRFMEEELAIKPYDSGNQRHKAAKKLARDMMLRNEAYNNLVRKELSDHIRLSMHPSVNNGYKYSFKLIPGNYTNHSSWHSAIVVDDNEYKTIHRKDAEAAGYKLVYKDKQPYNFTT